MDTRYLVTTRFRTDTCPQCQKIIFVGLESGMPYRVDPIPINPLGELATRAIGKPTFWMCVTQLAYRYPEDIRADTRRPRPVVLRTHQCTPPTPELIDAPNAPQMFAVLEHLAEEEQPPPPGDDLFSLPDLDTEPPF